MDCMNHMCGCIQRPRMPEPLSDNTDNQNMGLMPQRPMRQDPPCQQPVSGLVPTTDRPSCPLNPSAPNPQTPNPGRDPLDTLSIAMAYVPMQRWNKVYDMSRGLTRGTIFPELDLPFVMGRCR